MTKHMVKTSKVNIVTGIVRFSYVNVFSPLYQGENRPPKFSVSIIIPKEDEETIDLINQAVYDCKQQNKHVWGGKIPDDIKGGLRDGDLEKDDEAYDNSYFINATSTTPPVVVDANMKDIKSAQDFYSGCYGRAAITFYAHAQYGSSGIGCTIRNIMKTADGPRLCSSSSPAEDFKK